MLTIQKLHDVKNLQKECETQGNFQLKLNWDMLENRDITQLNFFQYEKGELVAFLALYPFGSTVEVCGMVKPNERQKGIFSSLFKKGLEIALQNGYKEILLNAPSESHSAKIFLNKQGAIYKFTEHQMEWQDRIPEPVEDLTLRKATVEDLDISTRLSIEAFGMSKEDALSAETDDMLMIEINEKTVGKLRLKRTDKQTWISFFSILPEYQGKGIGRKVLQKVIKDQISDGFSVHLEVETKNDHALGLYKTVGFKVVHSQNYYLYQPHK